MQKMMKSDDIGKLYEKIRLPDKFKRRYDIKIHCATGTRIYESFKIIFCCQAVDNRLQALPPQKETIDKSQKNFIMSSGRDVLDIDIETQNK
jgi:hypothetical protein